MRSVTMAMLLGIVAWSCVDTSEASAQLLRRRRHHDNCAPATCSTCGGGYSTGCECGPGGYQMPGQYGQPGGGYTAGYGALPTTMGYPGGNAPVAMPNPPALGTESQANTVSITDGTFVPEMTRVAPGTTVKWVNNGQKNHTVTAIDGSWDSGNIAPGQSFTKTFQNAGTISYKCSLHPQKMEGRVIVEQAGAGTRLPGE